MTINCYECGNVLEQGPDAPPIFRLRVCHPASRFREEWRSYEPFCKWCAQCRGWEKGKTVDMYCKAPAPCPACGTTLYLDNVISSAHGITNRGYDHRLGCCSAQCAADRSVKHAEVTCQHCGELFQQKRSNQRYCSNECRVHENRKRA